MHKWFTLTFLLFTLFFLTACSTTTTTTATSNLPDKTDFTGQHLTNTESAFINARDGSVSVTFQNTLPYPITLPLTGDIEGMSGSDCQGDGTVSAHYQLADGSAITLKPASRIQPQGIFTVRWDCQPAEDHRAGELFKATMSFDYITTNTGIARQIQGSVYGAYT